MKWMQGIVLLWAAVTLGLRGAAWGQPAEAEAGAAGRAALSPGEIDSKSLCAVLIGVSDEQNSLLSRGTAESNLERVGEALRRLESLTSTMVEVRSISGDQVNEEGIQSALRGCASGSPPGRFVLVYYTGSAFSRSATGSGPWVLTTSGSLSAPDDAQRVGLPFETFAGYFEALQGIPIVAVLDVHIHAGPSTNAGAVASDLAGAVASKSVTTLVALGTRLSYLESPTATESYAAKALASGLGTLQADEATSGDLDGRLTVAELGVYLERAIRRQWPEDTPATSATLISKGFAGNYQVLAVNRGRTAALEAWSGKVAELARSGELDARLAIEAQRLLRGEHGIEGIPENRRADMIELTGRLAQNDLPPATYVIQRSILLGLAMPMGRSPVGKIGVWGNLPFAIRFLVIAGLGGVILYLACRSFLLRQAAKDNSASLPVMADDFLTFGKDAAKPGARPADTAKPPDSKRMASAQYTSIRPVKPISTPSVAAPGTPGGPGAPSPARGTPAAPSARAAPGHPSSASPATPPKEAEASEDGFENVERPPSVAELRARALRAGETHAAPEPSPDHPPVAPPAPHSTPSHPAKPLGAALEYVTASTEDSDVALDLDAAGVGGDVKEGEGAPPSAKASPAPGVQAPVGYTIRPVTSGGASVASTSASPGTPKVQPSKPAPSASRPDLGRAELSQPAAPEVVVEGAKPEPAAGPSRTEPSLPAISPGVLPAVVRAWDLDWIGPMAKSRFRVLLGSHLEMGRPAVVKDGEETDLIISLLPVGDDRKPNAALIAMLSRKAFAVDLLPFGVQIALLNKAATHVSSDPHKPHWDWENQAPGTERRIAQGETLWVSPHFGKVLAPISIRCVATAGSTAAMCSAELRFDAIFHDLSGVTVLLLPEGFELAWGSDGPAQVAPTVGEEPGILLRCRETAQGLAVTPLQGGKWSRRQGKMLDEQTLLLGGVSSVEWKTARVEVGLKLTPHALPRLAVPAAKPLSGPKSS